MSMQEYTKRVKALTMLLCAAVLSYSTVVCSCVAQTKANFNKEDKIDNILSRTHLLESVRLAFEGTIPTMVDAFKKKNPNMTPDQTAEIINVIRKSAIDLEPTLKKLNIEIYDSQLNDEQVDALYDFYSTPIGAQVAEKEQDITKAAMSQGGTWGRSIWAPELIKRLESDEALRGLNF
jgi:hypothetical protein